ncbi:GlxA family transcriptional regulator [Roseovarius sp. PS-C2]|uniref:GlxA family transcriptional regulator n=1 Tax=Roseovarius sp. PS-C2 TaxID=2820814 RepID=UPI001C0B4F02|nr:GlxA family transcriptional regulator [Roseovarius sp. PS-C2]MBU3261194.1 GlxA family transcriptional regulator [Roseovarius sp. PS-C2]
MTTRSFVPRGAASFSVAYDGPPRDVYFLLLPKLTLLAFTSALEPLRVANQVAGRELYRWYVMSEEGGPVTCSCGVHITPDSGLTDVPRDALAFVCAGIEPASTASRRATQWIRRQRTFGCRVGGICTGAFSLAQAGLLEGRRFTLHWENQPAFVEKFMDLEPTGALYEIDGPLVTCGGGSAATDMMLDLIERDHGADLATIVADMCLHVRSNLQDRKQKSAFSFALSSRNTHLIAAMHMMNDNLDTPLPIDELSLRVGISRRQLERLFTTHVGSTPAQFYIDLRISRAHALLNETDLGVAEIAAATGFNSTSQMATRFRKRFGKSPRSYRKKWSTVQG